MAHHGAAVAEGRTLVSDDMGELGVAAHLDILEQDAVLDHSALFHGNAGEQDGVEDHTVDAAAVSHQGVQALALSADIGGRF